MRVRLACNKQNASQITFFGQIAFIRSTRPHCTSARVQPVGPLSPTASISGIVRSTWAEDSYRMQQPQYSARQTAGCRDARGASWVDLRLLDGHPAATTLGLLAAPLSFAAAAATRAATIAKNGRSGAFAWRHTGT